MACERSGGVKNKQFSSSAFDSVFCFFVLNYTYDKLVYNWRPMKNDAIGTLFFKKYEGPSSLKIL